MHVESSEAGARPMTAVLWHGASLVILLVVPTVAWMGVPFWDLPPRMAAQAPVFAVGYLLAALVLTVRPPGRGLVGLIAAGGIAAGLFLLAVLALLVAPRFDYSRGVVAVALALGVTLVVAPRVIEPRSLRHATWPLVAFAAVILGWGGASLLGGGAGIATAGVVIEGAEPVVASVLHNIRVTRYEGLTAQSASLGGGLALDGDDYIVANGVGEFWRMSWDDGTLQSTRMDLPPLLNRDAFIADNSAEAEERHFRITDVSIDRRTEPNRILASHDWWDPENRCVTIRLSGISLPERGERLADGWETIYSAEPCLRFDPSDRLTNHSGGRMAWTEDGQLLLTVGEMVTSDVRPPPVAQELDKGFGKILAVDIDGTTRIVSSGHRNPQGLTIRRDGSIWETEHGPRGGDELNVIRSGGNYGWPYVTYGTASDEAPWPDDYDGPELEYPAYAWLPSVGISNLIEVGSRQFPQWDGDLLVSSLNGQTVFRIRTRGDRVVYAEPIAVGDRIRDLVEDEEGRIVLFTDRANMIVLTNAGDGFSGEVVFARCAVCHEPLPSLAGQAPIPRIAPNLRGVLGRPAGRTADFEYSGALQDLEMTWTEENLDAFLENPAAFLPGTLMQLDGLPTEQRRVVIEYLATY